jgi:hypothetical protein
MGPRGDAQPVDPYANPSTPPPPSTNVPASPKSPAASPAPSQGNAEPSQGNAEPSQGAPAPSPGTPAPSQGAPAPSQQQPPPQAPEPGTTPADAKPQPPASEGKATPPIDKPAPAPVDQPAPRTDRPAQSGAATDAPVTSLTPPGETPSSAPVTSLTPGDQITAAPQVDLPRAAIVDVASAPPACRDAGGRVSSRDHNTALASKVSFAICTASSAMASISLVDAEASVRDLDHATGNAFALLDEVASSGDPRWQIVALHAEGDLLGQMTRRMLDTVPPAGAGAPQSAVELHDSRLQLLQAHLDPWRQRARKAFAQVDQLARANPQLAKTQLVGSAVADSRRRMTDGLATR